MIIHRVALSICLILCVYTSILKFIGNKYCESFLGELETCYEIMSLSQIFHLSKIVI